MLDIYTIPIDDEETWNLIGEGKTKGIFQLENHLGQTWCKKIRPRSIDQLAAVISLIRPGCLKAMSGDGENRKSMTQSYADRNRGAEEVTYISDALEPILRQNLGIILYQEDAIKIAQEIAGFNLQEADKLRKSISKKDAAMMRQLESQFIDGCIKTGKVDKDVAIEIFGWIRESQKYSFNRSHAVSYAMNGYRTAYIKAHYPIQFFAAWLLGSQWKSDPQKAVHEMVNDARTFGITVNPPSLLFHSPTTHIHNSQIYFGVGEINGIGEAGLVKTRKVVEEWEIKLGKELKDFSPSTFIIGIANNINNTVAEALIWSGAVDWLGMSRTSLIFYLQQYKKLSDGEKKWCANNVGDDFIATLKACGRLKKEGGGVHSKNRLSTFASIVDALENPPHPLEDNRYKIITKEKQYLGISLTLSQSDMHHLQKHGNTNCEELNDGVEGDNLLLPCTIVNVSTTTTKKGNDVGKEMGFLNVEDRFGVLDGIVCFSQAWQNCKDALYPGNNVVMRLKNVRDFYCLEDVYTEDKL